MTPTEIEATLREAFGTCDAIGYPLEAVQKQVLLQALLGELQSSEAAGGSAEGAGEADLANPLDDLTFEERQILLHFIQNQNRENSSWKAQLLNDWLHNRDSGKMQVLRQRYGLQWLEKIQPSHIAVYADELTNLKVGDRIEVSNRLWEWVQNDDSSNQEWFVCTVIHLSEAATEGDDGEQGDDRPPTSCTVQFENGMEYAIQGIYEWNRYNWRWVKEGNTPSG
ncbi:MAG: hypothetical protein HY785_12505 [Oscillatoriophycideae cyanobacterium NC_groundwater_1537_Pr4_S-0.65um_50_18]|nr:hypothetical protein [Oscillatoriophycideae cyanobacterium NC_groundwater_1537_Pr4_S-0.65um_50_18]